MCEIIVVKILLKAINQMQVNQCLAYQYVKYCEHLKKLNTKKKLTYENISFIKVHKLLRAQNLKKQEEGVFQPKN